MAKGRLALAGVLMCPAECEMKADKVDRPRHALVEYPRHLRHVVPAEQPRLEIGQAPPGFAAFRLDCQSTPVGSDSVPGAAGRLQHMAVGEPDGGVSGVPRDMLLICLDCLPIGADLAECRAEPGQRRHAIGLLAENRL